MHRLGLHQPLPSCSTSTTTPPRTATGTSIITNTSVMGEFPSGALPPPSQLSICACAVALIVGLPAGVFAGVEARHGLLDHRR